MLWLGLQQELQDGRGDQLAASVILTSNSGTGQAPPCGEGRIRLLYS